MFLAKTTYSGKLKSLFEVLFSNTDTVCLTIDGRGITSEKLTTNGSLISVYLPAGSFDEYVFTFDEPQYIGLGNHINAFFKTLRNKTTVTLGISTPFTLDIIVSAKEEDGCLESNSATVISIQNVAPAAVYEYSKDYTVVPCSNFNTMCKSFSKSDVLDVSKSKGQLSFSFELAGIASKTLTFGTKTSDNDLYHRQFKSDVFVRIGKLASFADQIRIYAESDKPMLIEAISPLGTVKVFMDASDLND